MYRGGRRERMVGGVVCINKTKNQKRGDGAGGSEREWVRRKEGRRAWEQTGGGREERTRSRKEEAACDGDRRVTVKKGEVILTSLPRRPLG
jgi:hypothetical protein